MITIDGKNYNELELTKEHPIWVLLTDVEKRQVRNVKMMQGRKKFVPGQWSTKT